MIWVFVVVVAVLVIAAFLALLAGRVPYDRMSEPVHTTPVLEFPEDAGPEDIAAVRFDTALRGYRMSEVDALLDRLASQLESHEPDGALPEEVPAADPGAGAGDASGDVHAEPERGEHSAG